MAIVPFMMIANKKLTVIYTKAFSSIFGLQIVALIITIGRCVDFTDTSWNVYMIYNYNLNKKRIIYHIAKKHKL